MDLTYFLFVSTVLIASVDSSCWYGGYSGGPPGTPPPNTCEYNGWTFKANATFRSPAPYCEVCTCYVGSLGCCGYGWKGGYVGVPGCRRVIDLSTCGHLYVDAVDESRPCGHVDRIPAELHDLP